MEEETNQNDLDNVVIGFLSDEQPHLEADYFEDYNSMNNSLKMECEQSIIKNNNNYSDNNVKLPLILPVKYSNIKHIS